MFVPGKQNPADLISKPKPSKEYIDSTFWNLGPILLLQASWLEQYKMDIIIPSNLPDSTTNDYYKEFKQIPEVNFLAAISNKKHLVEFME